MEKINTIKGAEEYLKDNNIDIDSYIERGLKEISTPFQCKDYDDDCESIEDKGMCFMYNPCEGFCPYLKANN